MENEDVWCIKTILSKEESLGEVLCLGWEWKRWDLILDVQKRMNYNLFAKSTKKMDFNSYHVIYYYDCYSLMCQNTNKNFLMAHTFTRVDPDNSWK